MLTRSEIGQNEEIAWAQDDRNLFSNQTKHLLCMWRGEHGLLLTVTVSCGTLVKPAPVIETAAPLRHRTTEIVSDENHGEKSSHKCNKISIMSRC